MAIKIKLEGFDELIEEIEKASGEADRAAKSALSASAQIMDSELRAQLNEATESGLAQRMPHFQVKQNGGSYRAEQLRCCDYYLERIVPLCDRMTGELPKRERMALILPMAMAAILVLMLL